MGEPHVRAGDDEDSFSTGDGRSEIERGPDIGRGSKVGGGSEVRQQGQASLPRVQRPKQRRDEHRPRVPPARTDDDASSGLVAHGCAIAVGVACADGKRAVQRRRIDRVRGVPKSIAVGVVRGRRSDAKEPVGASRSRCDVLQCRSIRTIARGEEAGVSGIARSVGRSREERQRRTDRADRVPRRRVHSRRGARGRSPRTQATGTHRQGLLGRVEVEISGVRQGAAQERDSPPGTRGRTQAEGRQDAVAEARGDTGAEAHTRAVQGEDREAGDERPAVVGAGNEGLFGEQVRQVAGAIAREVPAEGRRVRGGVEVQVTEGEGGLDARSQAQVTAQAAGTIRALASTRLVIYEKNSREGTTTVDAPE